MKNIFKLIDQYEESNGRISIVEFEILRRRLNFDLSTHEIREIFSKIKALSLDNELEKQIEENSEEIGELNEDEFEKSIEIIKKKKVHEAMTKLRLDPEVVYLHLLYLVGILILIFTFIFLGIKAFAIAGVFSALINSVLPASKYFIWFIY